MTDQTKQKLKYWLFGLFTGGSVAVPVTAFFVNRVCDRKINEAVAKAAVESEQRGMQAMAEYVTEQQMAETETTVAHGSVGDPAEDFDINNCDVSIDDEEATEEARERTDAHERYLDMIDKYKNAGETFPRKIDGDSFINEQYMQKSYVNWYEGDNTFEEDLHVIDDPYADFGVTDGQELFRNSESQLDPDTIYIRNERTLTDFEITRVHGSYAELVGGERNLGEANT